MTESDNIAQVVISSSFFTESMASIASVATDESTSIASQVASDPATVYTINPFDISNFPSKIIYFITWSCFQIISFIIYHIPSFIFQMLSISISVTLSFSTILFIIFAISGLTWAYIRYKYLRVYSRLPEDPRRQDPLIDIFVEDTREERKSRSSYLDEFLSAIKIFGYLETPVFHELTKSMQTQKLDNSEVLFLNNESLGFTICVEGEINVYCEVGSDHDSSFYSPFKSYNSNSKDSVVVDGVRYQLLNNIKSGSPLSSFVKVLDLMTDSINEINNTINTESLNNDSSLLQPLDNFLLDDSVNSSELNLNSKPINPNAIPISNPSTDLNDNKTISGLKKSQPNLIAIPKTNATISIIPREAFLRLVHKYPKAASQIVQMILTKLYRVTFQASHTYLDLTSDILQTEINLNNSKSLFTGKLPDFLYDTLIDSLDDHNHDYDHELLSNISSNISSSTLNMRSSKLSSSTARDRSNMGTNIDPSLTKEASPLLHNELPSSTSMPGTASSTSHSTEPALRINRPHFLADSKSRSSSIYVDIKSRQTSSRNPGDLLSNVPLYKRNEPELFKLNSHNNHANPTNPSNASTSNTTATTANNTTSPQGPDSIDVQDQIKSTLTETICSIIGIEEFPIRRYSKGNNLRSSFSSELNSPLISGLSMLNENSKSNPLLNEASQTFSKSKMRSFSTTSLKSSDSLVFSETGVDMNADGTDSKVTRRENTGSITTSTTTNGNMRPLSFIASPNRPKHTRATSTQSSMNEVTQSLTYEKMKKEFADLLVMMKLPADSILIEENEQTPGLFYIIKGTVDVSYTKKKDENGGLDDDLDEDSEEYLYSLHSGAVAGYLGAVINTRSFVTVKAQTDIYVAFVPVEQIDSLCNKYPYLLLSLSKKLLNVLDTKMILLDYALEWSHSAAGHSLYSQGDPANGIYIVLNGRFRSVVEKSKLETNNSNSIATTNDYNNLNNKGSKKKKNNGSNSKSSNRKSRSITSFSSGHSNDLVIVDEHGQGESLGEVEVLTKTARLTTVVAIRDSETARIPRALFEMIAIGNPTIMVKVSRIVAQRVKKSLDDPTMYTKNPSISSSNSHIKDDLIAPSDNAYRTITILPVTNGLPVFEFGSKLAGSFQNLNQSVKVLTQASTLSKLGKHAFDRLAKMKQSGYFSELEERYNIIIYIADTPVNSSWTRTCIAQGDCILLLADAKSSPDVGDYERLLVKTRTTAHTELVLLHPSRFVEPGLTNQWLKNRIWVHSHHHLEMKVSTNSMHIHDDPSVYGPGIASANADIDDRFKEALGNRHPGINTNPSYLRDTAMNISKRYGKFLRPGTIEFLTKNSLKIGKLRSNITKRMESFIGNNHIDADSYHPFEYHKDDFMRLARILNGKAVGLVLGGGGARGISHIGVIKALEAHGIPVDLIGGTSIGAFVGGLYAKDYDMVPVYGRAKQFSGRISSMWRMIGDITYPVTSYVTGHEFNRGIWKAFGGNRIEDFWIQYYTNSTNITESVMEIHSSGYAWRYIRASMSLAGLLPPITDNGNMLLDGGYVDNLTVEEMKRRGAKIVFAVDVGSEDDRTAQNYGDTLSGLWVLLNRINPFSKHPNVPSMADIQMRLAYVSSVTALDRAKTTEGCIYLRPPIEGYATLDFAKFEELYGLGFNYANAFLKNMEDEGTMPLIEYSKKKDNVKFRYLKRRNSI